MTHPLIKKVLELDDLAQEVGSMPLYNQYSQLESAPLLARALERAMAGLNESPCRMKFEEFVGQNYNPDASEPKHDKENCNRCRSLKEISEILEGEGK